MDRQYVKAQANILAIPMTGEDMTPQMDTVEVMFLRGENNDTMDTAAGIIIAHNMYGYKKYDASRN